MLDSWATVTSSKEETTPQQTHVNPFYSNTPTL